MALQGKELQSHEALQMTIKWKTDKYKSTGLKMLRLHYLFYSVLATV